MKLHKNKELFKDAISATAQQKGIPEIYVEKDYWVTYALYHVFKNDVGKYTIFKGGTALSKCFRLIERFSEDIDLVLLRDGSENGNQLKVKIEKISKCVADVLPEIETEGITHKRGNIRKTAHSYETGFSGSFGQVRDKIIVEATWLGHYEPYQKAEISSLIYEMMLQSGQQTLIEEYEMKPFEVLVLSPKRTLCEKIMSLVRFSQTETAIEDLKNKVRHIYDIHLLLKDENLKLFFQSGDFIDMLLRVATDDVASFKNNNAWLANPPSKAIIFAAIDDTWGKIKSVYANSFRDLVFGNLPAESEILQTLNMVADRLQAINWESIKMLVDSYPNN